MRKFRKLFLAFAALPMALNSFYVANGDETGRTQECEWESIGITGPEEVKIGTSQEYVATPANGITNDGDKISYELRKGGELVESVAKEKYLRFFSEAGRVEIRAIITRANGCSSEARKNVRIYEKTLAYVGDSDTEIAENVHLLLKERSILLRVLGMPTSSLLPGSKDYSTLIEKHRKEIEEADYVVVNAKRPAEFFEAAVGSQANETDKTKGSIFSNKEIYVSDEGNGYLLSLTLAGYAEQLKIDRMWALNGKNVQNLMLLIGTPSFVGNGIANEIDFGISSGGTGFRKAFNRVAYAGFPVSFIGFVLSLTAAALVLAFFRQVMGFHTFGTFGPLFLTVSVSASSVRNVGILLASAIVAIWFTEKAFTKFRISYGARKTFSLGTYAIISIASLSFAKWGGVFDGLEIYATQSAILPFIFILLVADKLYGEGISAQQAKQSVSAILQFFTICVVTYYVLESASIRNALLSYPESVFAILAAVVATGRYSGLQVTEYYRFLPLIREKLSESNREE